MKNLFWLVVMACALPILGGSSCDGTVADRCSTDNDCGEYRTCDSNTGECLCTDDRACADGEVCNAAGRCQGNSGCITNADCNTEAEGCGKQFCDVKSNQCETVCLCDPEGDEICCTLDSQCPFGNICADLENKCVPGCRDDGDCFLGAGCVKDGIGQAIGQCAAGVCTANNLCRFGEVCNITEGLCEFDSRGPYCFSCTGGVASDDCGEPGNYCLTDSTDPTGQSSFCGVDCSQQQACPFGYSCNEVIIIPQTLPFCAPPEQCLKDVGASSGSCSRFPAVSCSEDEDCPEGPPGSDCPRYNTDCMAGALCPGGSECPMSGICPPFGHCLVGQAPCEADIECCESEGECPKGSCVLQRCVGGEGDAFGHCTCTIDSDCPRDECLDEDLTDPDNQIPGNCGLSGHTCFEDGDCDTIACVDGGCRIGANCAPANDRSCRELVNP